MPRRLAVLVAVIFATLVVSGVAAANGGRPFSVPLTGAAEVPGPGDPNATGQADLRLNQGRNQVCFDISWADIDGEVFAGHIHIGAPDEAGPVVVTLFTGSFAGTDAASGCVGNVGRDLIKDIRRNPSRYYVNVHSQPNFPGGAVRGQLSK